MYIVITGASKGIGAAVALEMADLEDVNLFLISRNAELLKNTKLKCEEKNNSARIFAIPFDLEKIGTKKLELPIHCPHIDIMINNAGYLVNKPFEKLTEEEIRKMMEVNFISPVLLIKTFLGLFGGALPTHIVNISSMGGFQGSAKFPGLSAYSASKAAIASITECLAAEYYEKNIFFNCLALGAVQTEMLNTAFPGYKAPLQAQEIAKYIKDFSLKANKYLNGKIIPVSLSTP